MHNKVEAAALHGHTVNTNIVLVLVGRFGAASGDSSETAENHQTVIILRETLTKIFAGALRGATYLHISAVR